MHYPSGAQGWFLTMVNDCKIESTRIFHGPAHHSRICNRTAVVRHRDDTRILHLTHLGKFLAAASFCYRPNWKDISELRRQPLLDNEASNRRIVVDGIRVGHRANSSPTAGHCSSGPGCYRFFVFLTGFAEVYVEIDETRSDYKPGRIKHLSAFRKRFRRIQQTHDTTVFDQQIPTGVYLLRRVNHITVCDYQLHSLLTLRSRFCFFKVAVLISFVSLRPPRASR